jgi:hypothetical protein
VNQVVSTVLARPDLIVDPTAKDAGDAFRHAHDHAKKLCEFLTAAGAGDRGMLARCGAPPIEDALAILGRLESALERARKPEELGRARFRPTKPRDILRHAAVGGLLDVYEKFVAAPRRTTNDEGGHDGAFLHFVQAVLKDTPLGGDSHAGIVRDEIERRATSSQ